MRRASLERVGRGVVARARRDASTSAVGASCPRPYATRRRPTARQKPARGDARGARATPRRDATDDAIAPRA